MTTALTTPTPTAPITAPPNGITEWGLLIAIVVWLGQRGWTYFSRKENEESGLIKTLITDLREAQAQLLKDSKDAQLQLFQQISLKESVGRMYSLTKDEVQRALATQANMYTATIERLGRLEQKLDALHRRLDDNESE
jgi:hypothetical protein